MVHHSGTRSYTAGDGRRFGLTLGLAFAALAAIVLWRGHEGVGWALGAAGILLVAAALVAPRALRPVEAGWMKFALALSKVTTPVFMGILYYLVITPFGVVRRTLGRSPLQAGDEGSVWAEHDGIKDLRRQF